MPETTLRDREFDLSDVISAGWGVLVSERGIAAVYEVLNYLTGDNLYTHQLPRAVRQVQPWIIEQYPALKDLDTSSVSPETWKAWIKAQRQKYGNTLVLAPMPAERYEGMDPIDELMSMTDKPIIVVKP